MKEVNVVAALFFREGRFFIARRPENKARGLLWEFVGGKTEPGETDADALARECREELDAEVRVGELYMSLRHEYPDLTVRLSVYRAEFLTPPRMCEHCGFAWILPEEIGQYPFCPADREVLEKIVSEKTVE